MTGLPAGAAQGVARVAGVERMQMLVESASRARCSAARGLGAGSCTALRKAAAHRGLRWAVDVDPLAI
jgi:primosomal protein N' (replication factor Y)